MIDETEQRETIVRLAASLFARGYAVGSAGNISVRLDEGYLITPTNASLGSLQPDRISRLDRDFKHVGGERPSKEVFMHRAFYRARPETGAVVHLHSTMATAVACLADVDPLAPIPPLTPYFIMRIGRHLPIVGYYRPGDPAMESAIHQAAQIGKAALLANHGPVVSGATLVDAVNASEELEESARLYLLLSSRAIRPLTSEQIDDLLLHSPEMATVPRSGRP